jgi:hypothetical protein
MVADIQKIRTLRLFKRTENLGAFWQIFLWWELRRIPFNLIVGATGIFTCVFLFGLEILLKSDILDNILPDPPAIAILGYGFLANVCFTGGWIMELLAKKVFQEQSKHFGEILFLCGMIFSMALTLLPILIYFVIVVTHR